MTLLVSEGDNLLWSSFIQLLLSLTSPGLWVKNAHWHYSYSYVVTHFLIRLHSQPSPWKQTEPFLCDRRLNQRAGAAALTNTAQRRLS